MQDVMRCETVREREFAKASALTHEQWNDLNIGPK